MFFLIHSDVENRVTPQKTQNNVPLSITKVDKA